MEEIEQNDQEEDEITKKLINSEDINPKASMSSYKSKRSLISQELSVENLPKNSSNYDQSIKIILLGDTNVGKSSIVNCLQQDENLQRKTISLEHYNYAIKIGNIILRMQIWDTVGQEKFDSITANYYRTSDVAIFVYAINDLNSFNNIDHWYNELNDKENLDYDNEDIKFNKSMIKVLVGNKKDLEEERLVSHMQGEKLCKEKNFNFFMEINCNIRSDSFFDESSTSYNNKEENEKKINENNIKINEEDKECVKKLFEKIGKIYYTQNIKEHNNRLNSSNYEYEASSYILEAKEEKNEEEDQSSCCC